jgi:hypothetical protein
MATWEDDDFEPTVSLSKGKWEGEDEDDENIPVEVLCENANDRMNGTLNQKGRKSLKLLLHHHPSQRKA